MQCSQPAHTTSQPEPHYLKGLTIISPATAQIYYRILQNFRERQKVNYTSSFVFEGFALKSFIKTCTTVFIAIMFPHILRTLLYTDYPRGSYLGSSARDCS